MSGFAFVWECYCVWRFPTEAFGNDGFIVSRRVFHETSVIPAKAGIQWFISRTMLRELDSCLRRNDGIELPCNDVEVLTGTNHGISNAPILGGVL